MEEVESLGGMTKAVESGMPKLRIEEAAARRQAAVDRGEEVVVGVNKYRLAQESDIEVRDVDNTSVREQQLTRLATVRANRDDAAPQRALDALREGAAGDANLLELSIEASRARATVGEISDALEDVFGRHRATIRSISGVYGAAYEGDEDYRGSTTPSRSCAEARRAAARRLLVVKLGQDGHDRQLQQVGVARAPSRNASSARWPARRRGWRAPSASRVSCCSRTLALSTSRTSTSDLPPRVGTC